MKCPKDILFEQMLVGASKMEKTMQYRYLAHEKLG